jgi:cholest-4-en-3-one 26-monooxygenase
MTNSLHRIDLFDPAVFSDGPPHEAFDRLRSETPVYWNARESERDGGFWALTRHADILHVSRDTETFTSSLGFAVPRKSADEAARFGDNIMYRDPPEHTQHRKPLNRTFTPKAMNDFEPGVRDLTRAILDKALALGSFDLIPHIAAELPAQVVCWVIGIPDEDRGQIVKWAPNVFFNRDGSPEGEQRFFAAIQGIMGYSQKIKTDKRACPADDVMSLLLAAEVNGCPMSEGTLDHWFFAFAQAGFETTHTLIAQGLNFLLQRPDLVDLLVAEPDRIPKIIEEMLRFHTPVNMMARTTTRDTEIAGQPIAAGQYVTMWYSAANRDPEVFDRPHQFIPDRSPNNHLAFGGTGSPHYCLGAHLARLEMRVLLEELVERKFPMRVVGPAVRYRGMFINALKSLPVEVTTR